MSLITCPECGKQISDKAPACIHCGFPLDQIQQPCAYNIVLQDIGPNKVQVIRLVRNLIAIGLYESNQMIETLPVVVISSVSEEDADNIIKEFNKIGAKCSKEKCESESSDFITNDFILKLRKDNAPVMCPKCGSTQIGMHKVNYGIVLTLLGSNVIENVCQRCGYSWRPDK